MAAGGLATLEIRRGEFIGRNQFGSVFPHPTAVPVPEEIQLTPAVARFLGLYAAEGFTSRNGVVGFAIATYEEDLTEFITSSMKNVFYTNPKVTDTTRHRRRVWCCSKALAKYFDEKFGRKAWNKHFPEEFVTGPLELVEGLLRGLWEGDGSVERRGFQRARLCTVSPRLAEQVVRVCRSQFGANQSPRAPGDHSRLEPISCQLRPRAHPRPRNQTDVRPRGSAEV